MHWHDVSLGHLMPHSILHQTLCAGSDIRCFLRICTMGNPPKALQYDLPLVTSAGNMNEAWRGLA